MISIWIGFALSQMTSLEIHERNEEWCVVFAALLIKLVYSMDANFVVEYLLLNK